MTTNNDVDFPMHRLLFRLVSSPLVSARLRSLVGGGSVPVDGGGGGGGRRRWLFVVGCCFRQLLGASAVLDERGRGGVVSASLVVVSWRGCYFVDVVRGFDFDPLLCWPMRYLRRETREILFCVQTCTPARSRHACQIHVHTEPDARLNESIWNFNHLYTTM